jgi:DNA polymerase elongation subunit (family B)
MQSSRKSKPTTSNVLKGWILDAYPASFGEVAVWIISENGTRIRLTDRFEPKIYITGKSQDLQTLHNQLTCNITVASSAFTYKYAHPTDSKKTSVLEVTLKDCRKVASFTKEILRMGDYQRYEVHNCDLNGDRQYFFSHDIFPLAFGEIHCSSQGLRYRLWDCVESVNYSTPPLRVMEMDVDIAKSGKIVNLEDPIGKITLTQAGNQQILKGCREKDTMIQTVKAVKMLDPDLIVTRGGDSYLLSYLVHRASSNDILNKFILSRDDVVFVPKLQQGKTFMSYGRTFYKAPTIRLFGRIHIDAANTFVMKDGGFDGLFEIVRTCRMPLHTAARASIGTSMASLQFYQAIKDDVLIPRNKSIPETFKSAYELLVGDRGGFVYEPVVGLHDDVGEVDFSSMYPSLMVNNNISVETVLCPCCPDSKRRIPELNYHICEKRDGIIPKTLRLILNKRSMYKRLKEHAKNPALKESYDRRQAALKWILVTCFGYMGYRNSKFGTIDGHIGVCAYGREALLKASHIAEERGFVVLHGIVDSLWLKKPDATVQEYKDLCRAITRKVGVPLNFEGRYKWIAFLPSKVHPNIGVLNRYYGVMEDGKVKVRGIEVRKRDTPKWIHDTQMQMIQVLASTNDSAEFYQKIPEALQVVRIARQKLLDAEVPVWDLMVTKHLSKDPKHYKQQISQLIAAQQALKEGADIHAGENIRYIYTHADHKKPSRRVKTEALIDQTTNIDTKKYLQLLYRSTADLLSFAGYTEKSIQEALTNYQRRKLTQY